jgi:DNA-binding NarL/FixJ family response regulator
MTGRKISKGDLPSSGRRIDAAAITPRELEVLQVLAEGASNPEIAQRLSVSPQTIKNHMAALLGKLDVTNRTHALVRAVGMGLVTIEPQVLQ